MNAVPTSMASSSAGIGPSGPYRCSASRATSMSSMTQPDSSSRTASPISWFDQPAAIISCSTRT